MAGCGMLGIPQIMGWWGIVLIQQTDAEEAELPLWRLGGRQLFPECRPRSNVSWAKSAVFIFFKPSKFLGFSENTCQYRSHN